MAVIFISLPSAGCHHRHFSEEEEVSTVNKLEVRVNANLGVFFIGDIHLHTDLGFGYIPSRSYLPTHGYTHIPISMPRL